MIKQKNIGIILLFTIIFSVISLYISKDQRNFIYVVPQIKNLEVLNPNFGNYTLEGLNSNIKTDEVKQINILNGTVFYNVPNGEYKITGEYFNERDEIILKKEKDWEKVYLDLEGVNFTKLEEKFLLFLTFSLVGFNIYLYKNIRKRLPKKNILTTIFYLLTLKILLSLRLFPNNNFLIFVDFLMTRVTLYLMIFYFLDFIFPKRLKKVRVVTYAILGVIYFYNLVIGIIICSPQFLVYLLDGHIEFLRFLSFLRKNIDLSRVMFLLLAITFFYNSGKIKRENIFSWGVIWFSFLLLEFFPVPENLIYFIDLMDLFSIYWFLVFYTFKVYSKNVLRTILYSVAITLSYVSLFYFKSITESAIILGTVILFDFYAITINRVMYVETLAVEHIYNRLCLTNTIEEFEHLLAEEIKKEVSLENILVKILIYKQDIDIYIDENLEESNLLPKECLKLKEFDYAYKIGFNKNREIALVFIKESENALSLGEQNFLSELFLKSANIINRLRLEYLYRGLK